MLTASDVTFAMALETRSFCPDCERYHEKEMKCESMPMSGASPLLRGQESKRSIRETAAVVSDIAQGKSIDLLEGPKVKVVLITEGMGNLRDKNYYGPEAIASAAQMFEGAVCMVDHPSESEEKDIPEGRVNHTVGYYRNLHVETVDGRPGCVGELHFDLSDEGQNAYRKCLTAVHYGGYRTGKEYIGLSVNAYGESEPRELSVDGETTDVNYVLRFVEVRSCDLVTLPARGGKIVALVESVAGARNQNKEVRSMLMKSLEKAHKALEAALSEADADLRLKKIAEAQKVIESLQTELVKLGAQKEAKAADDGDDDDGKSKGKAKKDDKADESKKKDESDESKKKEDDEAEESKKKEDADESKKTESEVVESDREVRRLAVRALVQESGLAAECFDVEKLSALSIADAKAKMSETKRIYQEASKKILASIGSDVTASHGVKAMESGTAGEDNSGFFADCKF